MDRVTSLRVFARAASAGSLSAAARQLDMSPAMAAKHVDALEVRLGVKLLHRSTRRLALTDAGASYLDAVQRILAELDEADAAAASQRTLATGLLRLNAPQAYGLRHLAPLLPAFSQAHPAVTVELGLSDAVVDLVEQRWDLAVRVGALQALVLDQPARDLGGIHIVWPAARHAPAKVRAMIDFLVQQLPGAARP